MAFVRIVKAASNKGGPVRDLYYNEHCVTIVIVLQSCRRNEVCQGLDSNLVLSSSPPACFLRRALCLKGRSADRLREFDVWIDGGRDRVGHAKQYDTETGRRAYIG